MIKVRVNKPTSPNKDLKQRLDQPDSLDLLYIANSTKTFLDTC